MKTSIAQVGYAPVNVNSETGAITYGAIKKFESELSGGREFSAEPKGELSEIYADGKLVKSVEINDGYEIKLILIDLIDDVKTDWLGFTVDAAAKTTAEYATTAQRPKFCLVICEETDDGLGKITYYYNCQVSKRPSKASKTSEGKFDAQYSEFAISAKPRATDKLVCFETAGTSIPNEVVEPTATA